MDMVTRIKTQHINTKPKRRATHKLQYTTQITTTLHLQNTLLHCTKLQLPSYNKNN